MTPELLSLHRYFIWAGCMRRDFMALLQEQPDLSDTTERLKYGPYMDFWYAGLYVVIEGWRDLKLSDPKIDELLTSPNVKLLKLYRNGAFHYQRNYWDHRRTDLMVKGEEEVPWLQDLHAALGEFFLRHAKAAT